MEHKSFLNPWVIYLSWIILFVLFTFIGIPSLSKGYNDVGEKPLILFSYALNVFIYGMFVISIFIPFAYRGWFRKYWLLTILVVVTCIYLII